MSRVKYSDWLFDHDSDDDLTVFRFFDRESPGTAYVDWYEFEHPQLGKLEIGGWDIMNSFHNPPLHLLEKEVAPFPDWFVYQALLTARLELVEASATELGENTVLVRLVVANSGYLSTAGSEKALENAVVRPIVAEIALPAPAKLLRGKSREEIGHLDGRVGMMASPVFLGTGFDATDGKNSRACVEWLVKAQAGTHVDLTARQERSGTVTARITL